MLNARFHLEQHLAPASALAPAPASAPTTGFGGGAASTHLGNVTDSP
jgi:hypothetical protein